MQWAAFANALLNVGSALSANQQGSYLAKSQQIAAETNIQLAAANARRRAFSRGEELGQQIWNIRTNANRLAGQQVAAMGASGFDVSSGDKRLIYDTYSKALAKEEGLNRSYMLQAFEDEMQTANDIAHYNMQAIMARTARKQYTGFRGATNIVTSALGGFLSKAQFANPKGAVEKNAPSSNNFAPSQTLDEFISSSTMKENIIRRQKVSSPTNLPDYLYREGVSFNTKSTGVYTSKNYLSKYMHKPKY